ncbi:hypothetical protein RIF29_03725 [Crotalaria pallida]|uniref:Uncharacterized protein n=1 Tax=Crotalaria pallida TaxID=3830 RepID=A0AAN9J0Z2_CROPI
MTKQDKQVIKIGRGHILNDAYRDHHVINNLVQRNQNDLHDLGDWRWLDDDEEEGHQRWLGRPSAVARCMFRVYDHGSEGKGNRSN